MNPYYNEVKHIVNATFLDYIKICNKDLSIALKRDEYVKKYAWAIPDDKAIKICKKYLPILEIGAGRGYWASLIGHDIQCFDIEKYENTYYPIDTKFKMDNSCTLMFCWPPYDDQMAFDYLKEYTGDTIIYIGEGCGGCTADDQFHDELENSWKEIETYKIPQWPGIHDYLSVWRRK
jgi:hypothetical protein